MILYLHGWRPTCGGKVTENDTMGEMLRQNPFKSIPFTIGDSGKNVVFVAPTLGKLGEVGTDPYKPSSRPSPGACSTPRWRRCRRGSRERRLRPAR